MRTMRQLENLGAQRAGLEDMLKEMKRKDDILPKLMASSGSQEELFRKEMAKYDHICGEIAQNIEAQEHLLLQIQAQNDEFAAVFNLEDYKVSREITYKQIAAAVAKYQEIKENINEGLKFYVTLQDAITNVKQQCSDFVMTRNIQCREMVEEVQHKVAGLNFSADVKTGYNYPSSLGQRSNFYRNPPSQQAAPPQQPLSQPELPSYHHHPPSKHPQPGYAQPYPHAQQPSHKAPGGPYRQPQQTPNHEYRLPAYPEWRGPYYNSHQQAALPGSHPPPPYSVPSPYPHQSGY